MLDLGFPLDVRAGREGDGATALHAAAAAGSAGTVRLLLERGADIEARDTTWESTPVEWAIVGSGMDLGHDPDHDWVATIRTLIEAGAATEGIVLSPDDPKPPSSERTGFRTRPAAHPGDISRTVTPVATQPTRGGAQRVSGRPMVIYLHGQS